MDIIRASFLKLLLEDDPGDMGNEEFIHEHIKMALRHPPPLEREAKSDCIANNHKTEGDTYLGRCMYQEAISAYTSALQFAKPNSDEAGGYYHARAIALQKLRAYEDSLLDLDRALLSSTKEETRAEIEETRKKTLALQSKYKDKYKKDGQGSFAHRDVEVSHGENPEIPGASSAIAISFNEKFGRFFEATKPIAAGDVLLVQEPYMLFTTQAKEQMFCHGCLKPTFSLIPCDTCTRALYCSPECRAEAYEKYHRTECKFSGCNAEILTVIRLFLIVTKQGACLKEMFKYAKKMKKSTGSRTAGFVNGKFDGSTGQTVLSLTNHMHKRFYFEFTSYTAIATVLLELYTDLLRGYNIIEVGDFMFQLTCAFKMNVVMIRDGDLESIAAIALYPVFNLLNHSCVNNTIWYTSKNKNRVLLASRDIKPGEQIFNNYLSQNILIQDAKDRKEFLSTIKHFTCQCEACERNYTFKRELRKLKVPVRLQRQLRKNPTDVEGMWQVLKYIYHERSAPCAEVELMKFALMEAYMNKEHPALLHMYRSLGVI